MSQAGNSYTSCELWTNTHNTNGHQFWAFPNACFWKTTTSYKNQMHKLFFFFFSPCGILLIIFEQKKKKIGILIHQSTNHGNKFLSTWELMDLIYFHFPLCKTISVSLHKSAFSKWMEGGQNTASKTGTLFLKWKFSGFKMNKSIALKKVDLTLFFCVKSSSL